MVKKREGNNIWYIFGGIVVVCLIIWVVVINVNNGTVCELPYILIGDSCCLDENYNNICDSDDSIQQKNVEQQENIEQQDYNKSYCPSMILTILDKGYSCVNKDEKRVSIQVSRGSEDIELSGMEITFYNTDTSWVEFISKNSKFYDFPESNEERVFTTSYPPTENIPQSVSIAAVITFGNDQITCDATDAVHLEDC